MAAEEEREEAAWKWAGASLASANKRKWWENASLVSGRFVVCGQKDAGCLWAQKEASLLRLSHSQRASSGEQ